MAPSSSASSTPSCSAPSVRRTSPITSPYGACAWPSASRSTISCSAAIWVRSRIASPENVPQTSSVASPPLFPLPHRSLLPEPQLLFPILNRCLLMLALWSCGRRGSVVQAQRQIHRALCMAIAGRAVRATGQQVQLAVLMRKARISRGGSEYHLVRGFSAPYLQAALQCSQLSVRVYTGALSLQPL